jgi:hypothetical protein
MTGMLGLSRMSEEGIDADPVNDADPANEADPRTTLVVDTQS